MQSSRTVKPYVLSYYFRGDETKFVFTEKFYRVDQYEKWRLTFADFVVFTEREGAMKGQPTCR